MQDQSIVFGPFRLDPENQQLWRGEQAVALQPKPLAVLQYLAQRPGQVVSKQELLKAVWAGTVVTKAVVKECIRAVREALGEEATTSQYLETIGREGYRFCGEGTPPTPARVQAEAFADRSLIVGREREVAQLQGWLRRAVDGQPQLVFVTGEPGIGKTAVVELFRQRIPAIAEVTIGYGQCIEQYGGGEAYLPMLEALGRLCREAGGPQLIATLRQYAPTWLVQLPGVMSEEDRQALQLHVQGATQQRMLREMAEAIEQVTSRHPLVLLVEDLHWSDQATVELLSYLAQRREHARLLVLGTYRPAELVLGNQPLKALKQELLAKRQCEELRVELLSQQEVGEYLTRRFPQHRFPFALAEEIHRRTEGNALFMVNVVEELLQQERLVGEEGHWIFKGDLTQLKVPDTLRQLIEKQFLQLGDQEQRALEVASVVGAEFAVAAVAAGLKQDIDAIEDVCEGIAWQGHFLEETGVVEWPDGTVSGRYTFRHALYQNVLYERIAEARRMRLHRLIGERLETGYRERAKEIAAELALHFERGRDYWRAVQYLQQVGQNALARSAHMEAISHLTKGLEVLRALPDTPERTQQELMLQITLGASLQRTQGYAAPEVGKAYARARELCQQLGEPLRLFPVLRGLSGFYIVRGEYQTARELGEQLLRLAQSTQDPALLLEAHHILGQVLYFLGKLVSAREHLEQGIALYDPQQHHSHALLYGHDPGVACLGYTAYALWYLGYPDQAVQRSYEAFTLAKGLSHPYSMAYVRLVATRLHQFRQEGQTTQEQAEALISLSAEQGFTFLLALGTILWGCALAGQGQTEEGIAQICQGLTAFSATGAAYTRAHFLALLAETYEKTGQRGKALSVLAEALVLVEQTGERYCEAELYRLKGELTLQSSVQHLESGIQKNRKSQGKSGKSKIPNPQSEAEACFLKAVEIAHQQQAKSLELRAVMSLSRLWQQQGKKAAARQLLSEIYNWFTEGFDTKDLQEARALLEELRGN